MIDDRELWAFAMALLRDDSGDGAEFTRERMNALEEAGRAAGVDVWKEIANRVNAHAFEGVEPPK